jgi:hypothetical protein
MMVVGQADCRWVGVMGACHSSTPVHASDMMAVVVIGVGASMLSSGRPVAANDNFFYQIMTFNSISFAGVTLVGYV